MNGRVSGADDPILEVLSLQRRFIGQLQENMELLTEQNNDLLGMVKQQQRASEKHEQQLAQLAERTTEQAARGEQLMAQLAERSADQAVEGLVGRGLDGLSSGCAELINYAQSTQGFAAQAGLFINHPVWIGHFAGSVAVREVSERIIEIPYVFAALNGLARESHILDFGATESTLSLSLASLGHHVVALDLRPYRLSHPRVEVVVQHAEEWAGPSRPFDAIISLSTLEHVGLGHYDEGRLQPNPDLDRIIVERFRTWLRPNGLLILTAPFGPWHIDDFQRTYDSDHLEALFQGWNVLDRTFGLTMDLQSWDTSDEAPPLVALADSHARAVVMLRATPAG